MRGAQCNNSEMNKPTSNTVTFKNQHKIGAETSGLLWKWDNKQEACS